jgi:hypothetical protein
MVLLGPYEELVDRHRTKREIRTCMKNGGRFTILDRLDMRRRYSMNEGQKRRNSPEIEIYS